MCVFPPLMTLQAATSHSHIPMLTAWDDPKIVHYMKKLAALPHLAPTNMTIQFQN